MKYSDTTTCTLGGAIHQKYIYLRSVVKTPNQKVLNCEVIVDGGDSEVW